MPVEVFLWLSMIVIVLSIGRGLMRRTESVVRIMVLNVECGSFVVQV